MGAELPHEPPSAVVHGLYVYGHTRTPPPMSWSPHVDDAFEGAQHAMRATMAIWLMLLPISFPRHALPEHARRPCLPP